MDGIFTPESPIVSAKGAVVTNIAHIPAALTEVMRLNGVSPDFSPRGSLALKAWMANDQGLKLPTRIALPVVQAPSPYDAQIKALSLQIGAVIARQNMKDASGASMMDPATQVTSVHGHSVLDMALEPLEAIFALPLVHEIAGPQDRMMLDIAIASEINLVGDPALAAADAAREAGNSPNTVMAAAAAIIGPKRVERALACTRALIDLFAHSGMTDAHDESFNVSAIPTDDKTRALFLATGDGRPGPAPGRDARRGARARREVGVSEVPRHAGRARLARRDPLRDRHHDRVGTADAKTHLAPDRRDFALVSAPLRRDDRRLDPGTIITSTAAYAALPREERFSRWTMADFLCLALIGRKPTEREARPLQILTGLLISNGPGAMSLQGAKGAVSADGPQTPGRVQINKGMVGFLTHTGYSHGGNGFEGMAFLLERFQGIDLKNPTDPNHGIDLAGMAKSFAEAYREEKANARELGAAELRALPGIHHPVFKGKPVNYDPRERFIAKFMEERGDYNIFHAYYRELVQALYDAGATPYVFCVNVDAIIAALLLAVLWQDYRSGTLTVKDLETAAFNVFLYGRMIGAAAEIDDHLNRGRNMDMRTPQDNCRFIV